MSDTIGRAAYQGAVWSSYGIPTTGGGWAQQTALGAALIGVANLELARIREAEEGSTQGQ